MKFTAHALDRLKERSTLEPSDILSAINKERVEIVTVERWTNRISYLFFSATEEKFHILVIDKSAREIITIIPIEYWENLRRHNRKNRIPNPSPVTKADLFNAVRKVDSNHRILQHPPLFGRATIYFFAYYLDEEKVRKKRIGFIDISDLTNYEKEECVKKLKSCIESGLEELNLQKNSITILWKTTASAKSKPTDREYGLQFDSFIDFDTLYTAVHSDIGLRIENSRIFPDFHWFSEKI